MQLCLWSFSYYLCSLNSKKIIMKKWNLKLCYQSESWISLYFYPVPVMDEVQCHLNSSWAKFATPINSRWIWQHPPSFYLVVPGYLAATGTNSCVPKGKTGIIPSLWGVPSRLALFCFSESLHSLLCRNIHLWGRNEHVVKARNISLWSFGGMTSSLHNRNDLGNQPQQELIFYS